MSYSFKPSTEHGFSLLSGPYDHELKEFVKAFPGSKWQTASKSWRVPNEVRELIRKAFPNKAFSELQRTHFVPELPQDLKDYQWRDVLNIIGSRAWLLQYDTGLGKTRTAIEAMRIHDAPHNLIVCPANVITGWGEQFRLWGVDESDVALFLPRKKRPAQAKYNVISYGTLKKAPPLPYGAIVFDELHYLLNSRSNRSKECAALARLHPKALRMGLTATPVSTEIYNIWHQVDTLCPGRLGSWWKFIKHYFEHDFEGYNDSLQIHGLKADAAPELEYRLAAIGSVVRKDEVAHELPPIKTSLQWYGEGRWTGPINLQIWKEQQEHYLTKRTERIRELGPAENRIFITYLRESAERLAEAIGVPYVHGDKTPTEREKVLRKEPCVVVTMDSIKEGIDYLTRFTDVHFLELYPAPIKIIQTIGRFHRLSSNEAVHIHFHGLRGTVDELICSRLYVRIEQQAKIWSGGIQEQLTKTLGVDENDEQFLAGLNDAVDIMLEDCEFNGYDDGSDY